MAKIDKSQYTKEQAAMLMKQRRLEKESKKSVEPVLVQEQQHVVNDIAEKNYVLCLKHGNKYSFDYVNKLFDMVKRHCTLEYEFVCLTDNPTGLYEEIKCLPLPSDLMGWWCKPYMFSKDLPINGNILYMDLDVVIARNIDKLFTYQPGHWCTIRDFTRVQRPKWHKYNSSVVRFKTGQLSHVWEEFNRDKIAVQRRFFGDQDWLYEATHSRAPAALYPDSWIQSWKWEVRKSKELSPGLKGTRKFKEKENVIPRVECCVCVFHGDPNPHLCDDPWVLENWK